VKRVRVVRMGHRGQEEQSMKLVKGEAELEVALELEVEAQIPVTTASITK